MGLFPRVRTRTSFSSTLSFLSCFIAEVADIKKFEGLKGALRDIQFR